MRCLLLALLMQSSIAQGPAELKVKALCDLTTGFPLLYRLERGDYTVLDELVASRSLPELYFLLSQHEQMPGTVSQIRIKTIEALQKVPGYAKYLGDKVDALSEIRGSQTSSERSTCLGLLGRLGTPEAFEEIGRFLFDERNPDELLDDNNPVGPNHFFAAISMYEALDRKGAAPFKTENVGRFLMENVEPMQRWWLSDSSKPFRVAKAEPKPPPPSTGGQDAAPPQTTVTPASSMSGAQPAAWWVFTGLVLLALAAIFLATRKRKA